MDAIKTQLMSIINEVPDCTATRQRLRSVLSDYFPTEKQLINSILNAYDEDVENRLKLSSDRTLSALQLIKVLKNDYGMTDSSALMALECWCYMLGYEEVAEALADINVPKEVIILDNQLRTKEEQVTSEIGLGVYKAGVDFPAGELSIQLIGKSDFRIYYGVGKNPSRINTDKDFRDKIYINIEDGQFLRLETMGSDVLTFRVTKTG